MTRRPSLSVPDLDKCNLCTEWMQVTPLTAPAAAKFAAVTGIHRRVTYVGVCNACWSSMDRGEQRRRSTQRRRVEQALSRSPMTTKAITAVAESLDVPERLVFWVALQLDADAA